MDIDVKEENLKKIVTASQFHQFDGLELKRRLCS